jgi:hypothetical protein
MTYRQLRLQHKQINDIAKEIEDKNNKAENSDHQRRQYNRISRAYNHKLGSFLGKIIANKLDYVEADMIVKEK